MNYITDILNRADLQQIRSFLLNGVECYNTSNEDYKQRLATANESIFNKVRETFPKKAGDEIINHLIDMQDIYMELGIQCGVILATQLLTKS